MISYNYRAALCCGLFILSLSIFAKPTLTDIVSALHEDAEKTAELATMIDNGQLDVNATFTVGKHNIQLRLLELFISHENIELVKLALDKGARIISGKTVFKALDTGNLQILDLLFAHGANINGHNEYETCLEYAITLAANPYLIHDSEQRDKYLDEVMYLIERGADVNLTTSQGISPLDFAILKKVSPEILVMLLLYGAEAHESDLNFAQEYMNVEAIKLCLVFGVPFNTVTSRSIGQALQHDSLLMASVSNDITLINNLFPENPDHEARLRIRAQFKDRLIEAFFYAIGEGHADMVQRLLHYVGLNAILMTSGAVRLNPLRLIESLLHRESPKHETYNTIYRLFARHIAQMTNMHDIILEHPEYSQEFIHLIMQEYKYRITDLTSLELHRLTDRPGFFRRMVGARAAAQEERLNALQRAILFHNKDAVRSLILLIDQIPQSIIILARHVLTSTSPERVKEAQEIVRFLEEGVQALGPSTSTPYREGTTS